MEAHVYQTALKLTFRGLKSRSGVLIRGEAGWAEFSPFAEYDDAESAHWWRAAHEAATVAPPAPVRSHIPVNVTIPATDRQRAHRLTLESGGCTTAKVKVAAPGDDVTSEAERLAGVREALGPQGRIRIDANGAWDLETAVERLVVLDRAAGGLEYAEQPCASTEDLARLRRRTHVPVAADESIRRSGDPDEVVRREAADVIVLKVQPLGGVRACLELAERLDLPVVVSSALESSVGIAQGVALAAALPRLDYACGLATVHLLERDPVRNSLLPSNGMLPVGTDLGVDPSSAPADPELTQWWLERFERVRALGVVA